MSSEEPRPGRLMRDRPFWSWASGVQLAVLPAAMAPLAFTGVTTAVMHSYAIGAAMISGLILSQVIAAVPVSRLLDRWDLIRGLRALLTLQAASYLGVLTAIHLKAPPAVVVGSACLVGTIGAGVPGGFRSMLAGVAGPARLRRAVAVNATLTEFTFVVGPLVVGGLGLLSNSLPILAMGAVAALAVAFVPSAAYRSPDTAPVPKPESSLAVALAGWLAAAFSASALVAVIEVGAIALATRTGHRPVVASIVVAALCVASVTGGVALTTLDRQGTTRTLAWMIATMTLGGVVVSATRSLPLLLVGAIMIGSVLAPVNSILSLLVEDRLPVGRTVEGFSLVKTAQNLGAGSGALLLAFAPVSAAAVVATGCALVTVPGLLLWARP